ncbi:hypothetical protein GCM10023320_61700 [Pseudonocardia adelaidensis]|uniref:Uncharacterized protein n=1 Tax=Pseudonocardia adelaidensis TaxID=648754 RepID=A0ABP9NU71_9PSEU
MDAVDHGDPLAVRGRGPIEERHRRQGLEREVRGDIHSDIHGDIHTDIHAVTISRRAPRRLPLVSTGRRHRSARVLTPVPLPPSNPAHAAGLRRRRQDRIMSTDPLAEPHRHDRRCYWDHTRCGWVCPAPRVTETISAAAPPPPEPPRPAHFRDPAGDGVAGDGVIAAGSQPGPV